MKALLVFFLLVLCLTAASGQQRVLWPPNDQGAWQPCAAQPEGAEQLFASPLPWRRDCVRLTLRCRAPAAGQTVTFGLAAEDPAVPADRLFQVTLDGAGQVSYFQGVAPRNAATLPAGRAVEIAVVCDLPSWTMDLFVQGRKVNADCLNLWNQIPPQQVYVGGVGATRKNLRDLVTDLTLTSVPQLAPPRDLHTDIHPGGEVRLSFRTRDAGAALPVRVYRDSQLAATVPAGRGVFVDRGLEPARWYAYALETVLPDGDQSMRTWPVRVLTRPATELVAPTRREYDLLVLGATPSGIAAALTAARAGLEVLLVSPERWIGGMMTGGLSRTDFGRKEACGGLFRMFMDEVFNHYVTTYGADSPQAKVCRGGFYFEPKVAREIFTRWLSETPHLSLVRGYRLRAVTVEDGTARSVLLFDTTRRTRQTIRARAFIDATYEGDLAAFAGAPFRIGREGKSQHDESLAGELWWDVWKREIVAVPGGGDDKVQAYNYRLCLTKDPSNRVAPPRPASYDRTRYLTLLPDIANGKLKNLKYVLSILQLPNNKADANNHPQGNPSSDLIGGSDHYPEPPEGSRDRIYESREPLIEAHRDHVLGLLHFLRTDPEVPLWFRRDARQWGFPRDEFSDNGSFPTQLYVREARRIVGEYLFTENDARPAPGSERPSAHRDSIAVGAYSLDSHATSPPRPEEPYLLEGFFYTKATPYQIPYRCLLPKGVEGVLVSGCVSSTHIGYGTLRMEPVFVSLGQAAGAAAVESLRQHTTFREVNVTALQQRLLKQRQVLTLFDDVDPDHEHFAALQFFGTRGFFPEFAAHPEAPVDRLTAARWLWLWKTEQQPSFPAVSAGGPHFADVPQTHPDYLAVESLRAHGVLSGSEFRPQAPLTAEEASNWLAKVGVSWSGKTASDSPLTRGQFCEALYRAWAQ